MSQTRSTPGTSSGALRRSARKVKTSPAGAATSRLFSRCGMADLLGRVVLPRFFAEAGDRPQAVLAGGDGLEHLSIRGAEARQEVLAPGGAGEPVAHPLQVPFLVANHDAKRPPNRFRQRPVPQLLGEPGVD